MTNFNVLLPILHQLNKTISKLCATLGTEIQATVSRIRQQDGFIDIVNRVVYTHKKIEIQLENYMFTVNMIAPTPHALKSLAIQIDEYIDIKSYMARHGITMGEKFRFGNVKTCKSREDFFIKLKEIYESLHHAVLKMIRNLTTFENIMKELKNDT